MFKKISLLVAILMISIVGVIGADTIKIKTWSEDKDNIYPSVIEYEINREDGYVRIITKGLTTREIYYKLQAVEKIEIVK